MGFIKDRLLPGHVLPPGFAGPVEIGVDNDAFWHEGRAIAFVECPIVARFHLVAEYSGIQLQAARVRTRIGVQQQFARIKPVAGIGFVRPVNAIAVKGAGPQIRDVTMEHLVGIFRQFDAADLSPSIEQAYLDF
jgi:hypothetical protein